jgi:hypothetical protein
MRRLKVGSTMAKIAAIEPIQDWGVAMVFGIPGEDNQ